MMTKKIDFFENYIVFDEGNKAKILYSFSSKVNNQKVYYDTAPTFRGKCYFCRKVIPKNTPRLWYWGKFKNKEKFKNITDNSINVKRKICFRCINMYIDALLTQHNQEVKDLKKIKKKFIRSMKGKKCIRNIHNVIGLEEIEKHG